MRPDYVFDNLEELRAFLCAPRTPAPMENHDQTAHPDA
jgi:hypothetical protein